MHTRPCMQTHSHAHTCMKYHPCTRSWREPDCYSQEKGHSAAFLSAIQRLEKVSSDLAYTQVRQRFAAWQTLPSSPAHDRRRAQLPAKSHSDTKTGSDAGVSKHSDAADSQSRLSAEYKVILCQVFGLWRGFTVALCTIYGELDGGAGARRGMRVVLEAWKGVARSQAKSGKKSRALSRRRVSPSIEFLSWSVRLT